MTISRSKTAHLTAVAAAVISLFMAGSASATAFDGGIPAGWTGVGNYGTLGANGVVSTSPEGGNYGWIASNTGITRYPAMFQPHCSMAMP